MILRKIAVLGHPLLLKPAASVPDPTAEHVRTLVDDMVATMRDAQGIGLAAPQVHVGLRVIVVLEMKDRSEAAAPLRVLFNPVLEPLGGVLQEHVEGCLSIPHLRGIVPRWQRVGWRAMDAAGSPVEGETGGLFARILQHEVDHLNGILFPMRMTDLSALANDAEVSRLRQRLTSGSVG